MIYILLVLTRFIKVEDLKYRDSVYLSMIILQLLIFVLPGIFYLRLRGGDFKSRLHIKPLGPRALWFTFSTLMVLIFGTMLISSIYFRLGGTPEAYTLYNSFSPSGSRDALSVIYVIIAFAVVPAITEEFVFRGIILSEYSSYGAVTAVIASSILFSMLHFNIRTFVLYLFCGAASAYAVYVTRSLLSGIVIHLANNLYALFLDGILRKALQDPNSYAFFLFLTVSLFLLFLFFSFGGAEGIMYNSAINGEKAPPEAVKMAGSRIKYLLEALISPPFLACVLFYFTVTLLIKR